MTDHNFPMIPNRTILQKRGTLKRKTYSREEEWCRLIPFSSALQYYQIYGSPTKNKKNIENLKINLSLS